MQGDLHDGKHQSHRLGGPETQREVTVRAVGTKKKRPHQI